MSESRGLNRFPAMLIARTLLAFLGLTAPAALPVAPSSSAAAVGASAPASCPSLGSPGDEHPFRIFRSRAPAGEITFKTADTADSGEAGAMALAASGRLDLAGRSYLAGESLRFDRRSYAVIDYKLALADPSGASQVISAQRVDDSLIVSINGAGVSFRRAFEARDGVLCLDNMMPDHLALLACRIAADGFRPETIRVVVPQIGEVLQAAIAPRPTAPDGSRQVDVRISTVTEVLSFNAAGRLDRADVPSQDLYFVRMVPGYDVPPEGSGETGYPAPPGGAGQESRSRLPDSGAPPGRALFSEERIQFVSKRTGFDGLLTLPTGGQPIPYPAVLLVAGSGPLDRDESIGENHPFRDLARGLAVYGIASLRFDKRSLASPQTIDPQTATAKEEVIDDAAAAIDYLRSRTEIDGSRIVIVGHGQGGALAGAIAREDGHVAGIVALEATLDPSSILPDSARSGWGTAYVRDYAARDLQGDFRSFGRPVLVLHAGKDPEARAYLDRWRALASDPGKGTTFEIREFPELGALFMSVVGVPAPASALPEGSVDPSVIDAIATFVAGIPPVRGK